MASVKVILERKIVNKDGTHPVRLIIIHERKRTIKTLLSVYSNQWDEEQE